MCKKFLEAEMDPVMGFEYGMETKFVHRLASGSAEHLAMWRVSKDGLIARASPMAIHRKKSNNTMAASFHYLSCGERGTDFDDARFLCNIYVMLAKPGKEAGARVQAFLDKVKDFTLWHHSFDI